MGRSVCRWMDQVRIRAHSKINLGLDVTGRRPNGYHDVRMVMQTLALCDDLTVSRRSDDRILLSCHFADWSEQEERKHSAAAEIPTGADNLCVRAAEKMRQAFSLTGGYDIGLYKRIPIAAGMAGGSTDAAAVLSAIAQIENLPVDAKELFSIAETIGADVPFCLLGGTALAEGIGEILTPLPPMPEMTVLVAKPKFSVSTPECYRALDALERPQHPPIDFLVRAVCAGNTDGLCSYAGNILEQVTSPLHPEIRRIETIMTEGGARLAMMTGSGPTVFGLFDHADLEEARLTMAALRRSHLTEQLYLSRTFSPEKGDGERE